MDTAKGIVDAASKMVFGENQNQNQNETGGVEPQSGQTGEGTAEKPYDAGNATGEPTNTDTSTSATDGAADPVNTEGSREPKTAATSTAGPDAGAAAPESGARPQQKQQGADRPLEAPEAEHTDAIQSKKEDAENAMSQEDSGEGPTSGQGQSQGQSGGQKDQLGSTSKEPGTGTKYEKSTGLAAEGGDFDATRPGAGKEADRILEEKGIHHEGNQGPPQSVPGTSGGGDDTGKPSLGQKIKDKLHIGKKDKD